MFSNIARTITLARPLPSLTDNIQILGPGREVLSISANDLKRVIMVHGQENMINLAAPNLQGGAGGVETAR